MATTFKTLPDGTYTKRENKIKVLLQRHLMKKKKAQKTFLNFQASTMSVVFSTIK
jgi:hypothetical protein